MAVENVAPDVIGLHPIPFPPVTFHTYDSRSPEAAARVTGLIERRLPSVTVEHIGSTAVPNCGGKGVIDLMVLYPPGHLDKVKAGLRDLGFQRDPRPGVFSEDRPMRLGTIDCGGHTFRLHVHVIAADSPEAVALLAFRDHLRTDPALVEAYTQRKRELIESGYLDPHDYSEAKTTFVRSVLTAED